MSCIGFLRRLGILPKVTESEFLSAETENVMRDNADAFLKLSDANTKMRSKDLLDTIQKTVSPFADLEYMMKQQIRTQRRLNERRQRK